LTAGATAAEAVAELCKQGFLVSAGGRVRKLARSDGWQTEPAPLAAGSGSSGTVCGGGQGTESERKRGRR
jgi:hypothetical protein